MKSRGCLIVLLLAGLFTVTVLLTDMASASDEELLELLRVGMYHRYHSVMSCKGTVTLVMSLPKAEGAVQEKIIAERELTVVFDGNRLRMAGKRISGATIDWEGAFDGENTTERIEIPGQDRTTRITPGMTGFTNAEFSLFVDPRRIGGYPVPSLDRGTGKSERIVGREVLDGDECVVLELTSDIPEGTAEAYARSKLWVNVDKGCAVPRWLFWYVPSRDAPPVLIREDNVQFRQYGDELWGPASYTRLEYLPNGTLEKKVYATYEPDFQINVPIPEDELKLTLPSGTKVYNELIDAEYVVP